MRRMIVLALIVFLSECIPLDVLGGVRLSWSGTDPCLMWYMEGTDDHRECLETQYTQESLYQETREKAANMSAEEAEAAEEAAVRKDKMKRALGITGVLLVILVTAASLALAIAMIVAGAGG